MRAVQGKDTKKGHWRSKLKNQKKSLPDFKGTLLRQPKKKGKAAESHVQVQTETSLQLDSTSQDKTYDDNITLNKAYNSNAQEKQPTNEQGYKDNAIRKHHSTTREQLMGTLIKKKKGRCSTKNDVHTNSYQHLKFGIPLAVASDDGKAVSRIVTICCRFIEDHAREGIYKIFGRTKTVLELKDMFSRGLVLDLEISGFDSVDVASLFKLYFRDLPGHILGTKSVLIALRDLAKDIEDTKERVRWIQHCLGSLPAVNMNILRYLIRHMQVIIAKDSLKMSRETFADAFSTTLDIPTIVIVDMVNHFSDIFEHEQLESANDSSSDESTSDSGGGSKKHREMGNGNSMEEQL